MASTSTKASIGAGVTDKRLAAFEAAFAKYVDAIRKSIVDNGATTKEQIDAAIGKKIGEAFEAALAELQGGIVLESGKKTAKAWSDLSAAQRRKIAEQLLVDNPHVVPWVKERSAELVAEIDKTTRLGLRALVDESYEQHLTRQELSRKIRTRVGLLERDVMAVERLRAELTDDGLSDSEIDDKTLRYANKLLSARAENIGRTEIVAAENHGQLAAWNTAADAGYIVQGTKKTWIASTLEDMCDVCTSLDGVEIELGDTWKTADSSVMSPPAHPQCRCTMGLVVPGASKKMASKQKTWRGAISKLDDDKHLVFGWLSVVANEDGSAVVDAQDDVIPPEALEEAVYAYVLESREMGDVHRVTSGVGRLVESVVFTAEKQAVMGIPAGVLPVAWWAGFYVDDSAVWERIKSGAYESLSIGGEVIESEQYDDEENEDAA